MSPRPRNTPADDSGEGDGLAELVDELRAGQEELRTALEDLRAARTPAGRRRAERDVRESESGLAKALRDAGFHDLSEDDLHELRRTRQRDDFERWFDERMEREGRELAAEADRAGAGKGKGEGTGKGSTARRKSGAAVADDDDADDGGDGDGEKRKGYFS